MESGYSMQEYLKIIGTLLLGLFVTELHAAEFQSIDSIRDAARQFIVEHTEKKHEQSAEISIGRLDSRLKLSRCTVPLDVYLTEGSRDLGRLTVGVRCADDRPWSLHVPATVTMYKDVVVTADLLPRGKILVESDFKIARYDVSRLPAGYIEDLKYGIGKELRRRLSGNEPLTTAMLKQPRIIKRGQQVSIIARRGPLEVRVSGKALAHGAVGERIRVLNLKSNKKLEGTVMPSGDIRVDI